MSKKVLKQKPVAASKVISAKPQPAATGLGTKKATPQSKSGRGLSLLKQAGGASLDELTKATRWQAHSVRGFLSGAVRKRKGLTVLSACDASGTRRYRIEEGKEAYRELSDALLQHGGRRSAREISGKETAIMKIVKTAMSRRG